MLQSPFQGCSGMTIVSNHWSSDGARGSIGCLSAVSVKLWTETRWFPSSIRYGLVARVCRSQGLTDQLEPTRPGFNSPCRNHFFCPAIGTRKIFFVGLTLNRCAVVWPEHGLPKWKRSRTAPEKASVAVREGRKQFGMIRVGKTPIYNVFFLWKFVDGELSNAEGALMLVESLSKHFFSTRLM